MPDLSTRPCSAWKSALLAKDLPRLQQLRHTGADLEWRMSNEFGTHGKMTALQLACMLDWTPGALWLIEQGACVDVFTRAFATPLSFAVKGGDCALVSALLQASIQTVDVVSVWDEAPLHICACADDVDIAQVLLSFGARFDRPNSEGKTPLDMALDADAQGVASQLRAHQACCERDMLDRLVETPLPRSALSRI